MSAERLVREALEESVKNLPCPEPDLDQLLASGRAMRRRRMGVVASLAVAVVLVLVLAGLSFAWAGKAGQALEPVPANPSPTSSTVGPGFPSELHQWIDALPAGGPPATPYWHDGTLYVNGEQIPAPYGAVDIQVAGDTVLVGGYEPQWALARGGRLEPLPAPAGAGLGLSVDGRIAYWLDRQMISDTTRFSTWDTETNTALASRTVPGTTAELLGVDDTGNAYWSDLNDSRVTRWDIRADTVNPTDLRYDPPHSPELFDGSVRWMRPEFAYRSPDGTKTLITDSVPRDPSKSSIGVFGDNRLRTRPAGPDDSVDPEAVTTLAISTEFPDMEFALGDGWAWWESNDSVLFTVDSDLRTYLLRCSANGGACQRVADLGPWDTQTRPYAPDWEGDWVFARAPVSP